MHGLFSLGTFQVFTFCCARVARTEAGCRWLPDWVEDSDRLFGQVQGSQRLRKIGLTGRKQSCSTGGCWCRNIAWQIFLFRKTLNSCSFHKPWHAEGKMKASELRSARDLSSLLLPVTVRSSLWIRSLESCILRRRAEMFPAVALCLVPTGSLMHLWLFVTSMVSHPFSSHSEDVSIYTGQEVKSFDVRSLASICGAWCCNMLLSTRAWSEIKDSKQHALHS